MENDSIPIATENTDAELQNNSSTKDATNGESDEPKLSKKAMKKAAKQQRYQEFKLERRAREKETRKEKKKILRQKRAAGELDEEIAQLERRKKRRKLEPFGGRVVVDLGFDEMMSEKEISSMTSQLAYTYSANRNMSFPFSLIYTSLNGRTLARLEAMNDAAYKRWSHTEWWQEDYSRLWLKTADGEDEEKAHEVLKASIVYLTADSDEELEELKPEEIYIIGGIVDRNRYKNLCLNKAKEAGIRTARLPIGRYVSSLPTRRVLTVNQVFEIMLKWVETRDWEQAFYSIIPKRKFQGHGKNAGQEDGAVKAVSDENGDEVIGNVELGPSSESLAQTEVVTPTINGSLKNHDEVVVDTSS
ncbi:trna (guanine-n-)-methyltransferase [Moniliophthora roreri]|uniref:tRNA (guanine(9)-N1)-methyltransferase n=1 Tax=Moniliophthora roreri TaxID=221103 RepID=A0A0W0FQ56_MONRR|nr:trna (guanine-n-)-methyltransferase [Moniliophthora roreri]